MAPPEPPAQTFAGGRSGTIEALVQTLAGEASLGIFLTDAQGRTLYVNDQLRRILGLADTPTPGDCWRTGLLPDEATQILSEWTQAFAARRRFTREFRVRRPDASEHWVMLEAFPLHTRGEDSSGYVGMVRDVTPRYQALAALHESEDRYRTLMLHSPHPLIIHTEGTIRFINPAALQLCGIPVTDNLEGRPLRTCFSDALVQELLQADAVSLDRIERPLQRRDGSSIEIELTLTATRFDDASAVQILMADVTARQTLARQLQQAKKTAAVATLAGGVAHEFNNCLTAIMGFSDLALMLVTPENRAHGHLQQVVQASKRARDLVTQLLVFGRQGDTSRQPISLDILLKETLRVLRGRLPTLVHLREWIPGGIRPVLADPTQLHQICLGLLGHAEQTLRDGGGVLEVRLENVELDTAGRAGEPPLSQGPSVRLTVSYGADGTDTDHGSPVVAAHRPVAMLQHGLEEDLANILAIVSELGGTGHVTTTEGGGRVIEIYVPTIRFPNSVVVHEPPTRKPAVDSGPKEFLAERQKER